MNSPASSIHLHRVVRLDTQEQVVVSLDLLRWWAPLPAPTVHFGLTRTEPQAGDVPYFRPAPDAKFCVRVAVLPEVHMSDPQQRMAEGQAVSTMVEALREHLQGASESQGEPPVRAERGARFLLSGFSTRSRRKSRRGGVR